MKVRTTWLVGPIVFVALLVVCAVWALHDLNVEQSSIGYDYKEKLFDKETVGTINISISDENWQKILADPVAEEYVEAAVTVNGETYQNVGVRAKGNSSLTSVASSDSERYSLKLDFAQYDSNQTFYGLDTINLNNNFSDTTQMKEYVSYELMEQLGVATPAHSYVKVNVNGMYYGLMLAVEEVGEAFAKTNFGSTEGYLFKPEGDGSDLAYTSDETSAYAGIFDEVKMNAQTAEKHSGVIAMMKQISEGDTSSLNIAQIAKYFALNTALVNMDSYQGSFKHNYYLYESGDGQFSIVPWDYNMAFGGFNMGGGRPNNEQGADAVEREAQQDVPAADDNERQPENGQMPPQEGFANMAPPSKERPAEQRDADENDAAQNDQPNVPNENREGMGGGLMLNDTFVTDDNVNFSITEPVSGTTVEARPLLQIILQDEEARALYDMYLEQIATEIMTEENVLAITTKLHNLLLEAVENDPSKFSTTEQFIAGVSGEQSLPQFAKQRSESILKQLNGEIEGVSNGGSGFGDMPEMNGEMPNLENMPEMNGEMPNLENMPEMNGEMPNFDNMPEMNGEMPNFDNIPGEANGAANATTMKTNMDAFIRIIASLAVIVLATVIVWLVSRMKYKRRWN